MRVQTKIKSIQNNKTNKYILRYYRKLKKYFMDFNEKQIRRIFFLSLNLMHKKLVKRTEETIVLNERHNDLELKNCAIDN